MRRLSAITQLPPPVAEETISNRVRHVSGSRDPENRFPRSHANSNSAEAIQRKWLGIALLLASSFLVTSCKFKILGEETSQSATTQLAQESSVNLSWSGGFHQIAGYTASEREINPGDTTFQTSGLAGVWHLNGTPGAVASGDPVEDSSLNGNHGTTSNANTSGLSYGTGLLNEALMLDGVDDHVTIPSDPAFDFGLAGTAEFTLSVWYRSDTIYDCGTGDGSDVLLSRYSAGTAWQIECGTNSKPDFWVRDSDGVSLRVSAAGLTGRSLADRNWHHIAGVYDQGELRLYVDGVLVLSNTGAFTGNLDAVADVKIGRQDLDLETTGRLDEVSIWSRALSASEIEKMHRRQLGEFGRDSVSSYTSAAQDGGQGTSWSNLSWVPAAPYGKPLPDAGAAETAYSEGNADMSGNVLLLHMDESVWNGTANEVADSSGAANHGTAYSGATVDSAGKFNGAGEFDGVASHVRIEDDASLDLTTAFALSLWIKPVSIDPAAPYTTILMKGTSMANASYSVTSGVWNYMFGYLQFGYFNGTGYVMHMIPSVPLNRWSHLAVTADGSGYGIYLNGAQVQSSASAMTIVPNAEPLVLGDALGDATLGEYHGLIDELAIWNRKLQPDEVLGIYTRGVARLKLQVRACSDGACAGQPFIGPSGAASSHFSELLNTGLGLPSFSLSGLPSNRYRQYRVIFETDDPRVTPKLGSVSIR